MPRPRTVSDEAILDAVLALAHRVGPARVTFASAAAETGLSAATLVQRFGTKRDLLLAADKRGIDLWVGALDRSTAASPLERVVEGLVLAADPHATPEQMANSVAPFALASRATWTRRWQRASCDPAPTSRRLQSSSRPPTTAR
jgi:AcrR family transcriptional regulator